MSKKISGAELFIRGVKAKKGGAEKIRPVHIRIGVNRSFYQLEIRPIGVFTTEQTLYLSSEAQLREIYDELDKYFTNPKIYE